MVAGGDANHAEGDHSFAAGSGALANDDGSFVWSDAAGFFYGSTDPNTFNVRAIGGMELVSGIDGTTHTPNTGLRMRPNSSGWEAMAGQPFDLFVNQNRAFRIEPASDGSGQSPNMIGGTPEQHGHRRRAFGSDRRRRPGAPANPATANRVTDSQGVIGGGANNQAGNAAGTVSDRTLATVGGGGNNTASGEISTVAGGFFNTASGGRAAVGGGESNTASGLRSTVAGGRLNAASGLRASVGGGQSNQATAQDAVVGGGGNNTASGVFSGVPSGSSNTAQGDYSLAAGRRAQATQPGTFVWADSTNLAFSSTVANQFSVRSTGGARSFPRSTRPPEHRPPGSARPGWRLLVLAVRRGLEASHRAGLPALGAPQARRRADLGVELPGPGPVDPPHRADGAGLLPRLRGRREPPPDLVGGRRRGGTGSDPGAPAQAPSGVSTPPRAGAAPRRARGPARRARGWRLMSRHTFVIQVYGDGPATLENLTTQERVPVTDLDAVGAQIERWLADAAEDAPAGDRMRPVESSSPGPPARSS